MGFIFCATIYTVLYQLFLKLEYFHSCVCVFPSGAILIINNGLLSKGRVRMACLALSRKSMSSVYLCTAWFLGTVPQKAAAAFVSTWKKSRKKQIILRFKPRKYISQEQRHHIWIEHYAAIFSDFIALTESTTERHGKKEEAHACAGAATVRSLIQKIFFYLLC